MKIKYKKCGDYYIPCLKLPKIKNKAKFGKYGAMRLEYLKEHRKAEYTLLLMNGELPDHLINIDNLTEELKQNNQMKWVQMMNNIKNSAEEIVLKELIYV